jgi:hypothetical protein
MLVSHAAGLCIVCLKRPPFPDGFGFSEEHVIPEALGGKLTCKFLCKSCNESFGKGFEARAKTDPSIRIAIANLKSELPLLYNSIESGQLYELTTDIGSMPGKFDNGTVRGRTKKMPDNSLMVPEEHTHRKLQEILKKGGLGADEIARAIKIYDEAPPEKKIEIAPRTSIVRRMTKAAKQNMTGGRLLDPLVCLKVVYEFAALVFGSPVFANNLALNEIRRALRERDNNTPVFRVDVLMASSYKPFHGIVFEGNKPYAMFQIRLFGRLAYRIHLPKLRFDREPVAYTHFLATGEETWRRAINN